MRRGYFVLHVPYVGYPNRTQWHPTQSDGPFAVLCRGTFKTERDAIEWGRANLNGTPYTLSYVSEDEA